jgi:prepilin-type N-terminal cleavage/methylation domain-containing protein
MIQQRVLRALRRERGYTLVEMLTVLTILGVVMGALGTLFVSATNSAARFTARAQRARATRAAPRGL